MGLKPDVNSLKQLPDFVRTVDWYIQVITPPPIYPNFPASADLNLRAINVEVPKAPGQDMAVEVRGITIHQPGQYKPNGVMSITFVETADNMISTLIKTWRDLCYNLQNGVQADRENVKANFRLIRLDRQENELFDYTVIGCYPSDSDPTGGPLNEAGGDAMRPSIIFTYDTFIDSNLLALA